METLDKKVELVEIVTRLIINIGYTSIARWSLPFLWFGDYYSLADQFLSLCVCTCVRTRTYVRVRTCTACACTRVSPAHAHA